MFTSDRLTRDERIKIYQWSGEGYSAREICKMFNKARDPKTPSIRVPGVEKILALPEAHKFVSQFRLSFLKDIKQIPISEKKVRLDDLEKIRQRLMYIINSIRVDQSPKEVSKFLTVTKRVIEVIDLARNEMEQRPGLSIGINTGGDELSELTDEQLQQQRAEILNRARHVVHQRSSSSDEVREADEGAGEERPAPLLLAPSEKLQRSELPGGDANVPDLRQSSGDNPGLPAV